ncbi:MAG: hypothetical protein CMD35_01460 [Flavobacteriales bacterium]|nr:hypothetical protein [Flavobacteriales bacterium]
MIKTRASILFLFLKFSVLGQDIHFSQYNDLPLALNPSLAGNMDGTMRTGTIYRNQWNSISVPFESMAIYADFKSAPKFLNHQNIGWGIQVLNDKSGNGGLSENILNVCGSYHHFLTKKENQILTAGISLGGFQKSIDLSKLNFENQFQFETANFGSITSNEVLENNFIMEFDINLGASWTYYDEMGHQAMFGFSVAHLNRPNYSFFSDKNTLARKYTVHGSGIYTLNRKFDLDPSFLFSSQNKNINAIIGTDLIYYLGRKTVEKIDLKVGLYARLGDALNFTIGMNQDNWSIDVGYDLNISGLMPVSKSRGAFEISISFVNRMFKGAKNMNYIIPGDRLL